jgi:flagellar basal-body rod modification protein FlgD
MSTPIHALSASASSASSTSSGSALTNATSGLGKDDFLKLLVAQLQNQDPLSPVNDQEFMGQLTAFSTLEQVTNMATSSERLNETVSSNQSIALIGHQVTYTKADGTAAEGTVEKVDFSGETLTLTISGEGGIVPGSVTEVR